jgi:hypothetical protein
MYSKELLKATIEIIILKLLVEKEKYVQTGGHRGS